MTSYEQIPGGGTGGGTGMDDDGNNLQSAGATYQIAGNQVVLLSRKAMPPGKPGPSVITILAAGLAPTFADDGYVDVRGTKGVRVTTGSPLMIPLGASPAVADPSTNGVEIIVAQNQKITLQCGAQTPPPFQSSFQTIEMTPDGITLQSGASPTSFSKIAMTPSSITFECGWGPGDPPGPKIEMTGGPDGWCEGSIKLALGQNGITINDSGVIIQGTTVQLNPPLPG
jgi:hypothetical protein